MIFKREILILFIALLSGAKFCFSQQSVFSGFGTNKYSGISVPSYKNIDKPTQTPGATIRIQTDEEVINVSPCIYGNNANVYMTQIVENDTLLDYLKVLSPTMLRFPGGNLSNLYFWNATQGNFPKDIPDTIKVGHEYSIREKYWAGNNQSKNTLSVDNYYKLLEKIDAEGVICANYSYARYGLSENPVAKAAHLAADWVRYDRGRTKYWEVGNENYGSWQAGYRIDEENNKDGQPGYINGELYGQHFAIFADSMRKAAKEVGSNIKIGGVMVEVEKLTANEIERDWNDSFLKVAGKSVDFLIVHSYYTPYEENSDVSTILNSAFTETPKMKTHMTEMCNRYSLEQKAIALTEWNIFAVKSKQSCSYINGMHAVLVLGELIKNGYDQASRWNLANGYANGDDHGMFNRGDEPGVPKWNPRPVFYYMTLFQKYFGDVMLKSLTSGSENIISYASKDSFGIMSLVVVNKGESDEIIQVTFNKKISSKQKYYYYSLVGGSDNPPFSQKVIINGYEPDFDAGGSIKDFEKIPAWSSTIGKDGIKISSPAYSVQYIIIDK